LAARYRDHNAQVGNLHPGQTPFAEQIVDVIPAGRSYRWDDESARIRAFNFGHANAAPAWRPASFKTRSLRRT
jgi:hypothetical protein